jgi:dTDP-L-rhamnose 4-epimerase
VASGLSDAYGSSAPRPIVTGEYRLGDVRHVVASPDRAAQLIGFRAGVSLKDGLSGLAEWSEPSASRRLAVGWP